MAGIDLGDAWADNVWESGVWADGVWAGQESSSGGGDGDGESVPTYRKSLLHRGFHILIPFVLLLAGCDSIFGITVHSKVADDPCYRATIWVDTLTASVDSVTYEWIPGRCD